MSLSFGFALPNAGNNFRGDIFSQLLPADQRVEAASGTQEVANGCLDNRVVELRAIVPEVTNANLLFNSSMAGATGSVLPTNWASGSVSGLTYTISSASTVQGFPSIEWSVSGTAAQDGDLWLACEPMQSGTVSAQIPSEYVGSMYCAKVSGTISSGMALQLLTQNFSDGAVQESNTKDLAAVTGSTFVRVEPNSLKTDIDLENRVNLRLYQSIASGEVIDFTIRVAAPQVEAGFVASPFISTASGAVSEVRGRPSILVVPQLTKSGVVYPQLPVVSGADFTFTRATTATRVNASGLIESVASGILRLDYPIGGGCPAALIEASAQNLVLQSRDLSVSGNWTASGVTAVKNAVGADGTASGATTLTATAASGTITQALSHASQSRIFSAFIRRVSGSGAIQLTTNGGTNWDTVTVTTAYTQLASVARTVASGTVGIRMIASGDVIEVDYTQGEVGPVATSPIPTTAASATRNADVCSVSGVSGYIGQTQGTIYAEVDVRDLGTTKNIISCDSGDTTNRVALFLAPNRLDVSISSGGTTVVVSGAITTGTHKVACSYSSGSVQMYLDGAFLASGTPTVFPTVSLNNLSIGTRILSGVYGIFLNDRLRAAAIYTTRLDNNTLANLTRLT